MVLLNEGGLWNKSLTNKSMFVVTFNATLLILFYFKQNIYVNE